MSVADVLRFNIETIRIAIAAACQRSGRDADSVTLVAVTKYAEWPWVEELSRLHNVFGENRPQQLVERQPLLPHVEWHLIGQLQRNKVRPALLHASLIHSVDSVRLLARIAEVARELRLRPRVLLQVNESGEAAKSGFSPQSIAAEWREIVAYADFVDIRGLMTMAAESSDPDDARPAFRRLRELRDELRDRPESRAAAIVLSDLSMGMSGDYVPAIEEGATLVRIGSRVFQGCDAAGESQ